MQKLLISEVVELVEVEPAIIEVKVKLIDDTVATLRMNIFAGMQPAKMISNLGH